MKTVRYCKRRLKEDAERLEEIALEKTHIRRRMIRFLKINGCSYWGSSDQRLIVNAEGSLQTKKFFKFFNTTTLKGGGRGE